MRLKPSEIACALAACWACHASAQVVTSSFDRSSLAVNPAAAATRLHPQVALSYRMRNSSSKITEERYDGEEYIWNEEFKSSRYEFLLTGGRKKIVPELYVSFDQGSKSLKPSTTETGSRDNKNDLDIINNVFNLGIHVTERARIGIKLFMPRYDLKVDLRDRYGDGKKWSQESSEKTQLTGFGLGGEARIWRGLHVGVYAINTTQRSEFSYTRREPDGERYEDEGKSTGRFKKYGAGLSYLVGSSLYKGFRWEIAYSAMEPLKSDIQEDYEKRTIGREIYSTIEMAHRGLTAGANIRFIKGVFYENQDLLEAKLGERTVSDKFAPAYGGFLSLNTKRGNSFGLAGAIWKQKGEKSMGYGSFPAQSKITWLTLSFAHLF